MRASSLLKAIPIICVVLFTPNIGAGKSSEQPISKAIVMVDNDISTEESPSGNYVDIPIPVQKKIHSLAREAFKSRLKQLDRGDASLLSLDEFYGPIYRITTPQERDLYIFKGGDPLGAVFYHLILFDPKSKKITHNPPALYGKWMEGNWGAKLIKPLVSFKDLDEDGQEEIVVQQRVHNGTMYNAVVYHYFQINQDLSLRRILALETRLIDLYTEKDGGIIVREITNLQSNVLKIISYLEVSGKSREELGYVILSRKSSKAPFRITERHPMNQKYEDSLVSGAEGVDENKFLSNGYEFYY